MVGLPYPKRGFARALASPWWIGAVAVLLLNDHVFKGSGLLPGWLTGKLSDFSGLFVAATLASVLLGAVLRGRSRWAIALGHAFVTLPFVAIKTSPTLSHLHGTAFRTRNVVDPTDLLALSVLPWSIWMTDRAARTIDLAVRGSTYRPREVALAVAGAVACMADQPPRVVPPRCPATGTKDNIGCVAAFRTAMYLGNRGGVTATASIAVLKPDAPVNCVAIQTAAPCDIKPEWFDAPTTVTVKPYENVPIPARVCNVALISIDDWSVPALAITDGDPSDLHLVPFVEPTSDVPSTEVNGGLGEGGAGGGDGGSAEPLDWTHGAVLFSSDAHSISDTTPYVCEEAP